MKKKYTDYSFEDFITDDDFFRIAKKHYKANDHSEEWNRLCLLYPNQKAIMEKAYILINGISLVETSIPINQIQEDWTALQKKIKQNRKQRFIYWASSVAACLILILSGLYFKNSSDSITAIHQELLSQLSETDTETESNNIQLIYGKGQKANINENAIIIEKEDGSIHVDEKKEIDALEKEIEYIQLIVPRGKRSFLELKDGSKIWINSGSKLLYPSQFDQKRREIYVEGEIYLEVARNERLPFFVHTKKMNIEVLGTSFNVTAYKDDPYSEVVLVSGNVKINNELKETTHLLPDMCYSLDNNNRSFVKPVEVYNFICWKDGIMKLNGEDLKQVFKRLSRYYNVTIEADPDIEKVRYYGKLGLDDTLDNILYNISLAEPISYSRKGETIYIKYDHYR